MRATRHPRSAASGQLVTFFSDADGKGPSIWDTYCAQPGRTYQGHTGEVACDQLIRNYQHLTKDHDYLTKAAEAARKGVAAIPPTPASPIDSSPIVPA